MGIFAAVALAAGVLAGGADSPPVMPDCSEKQVYGGFLMSCGFAALQAGDAAGAEGFFRRALARDDWSWEGRGWAVRSIGDARLASGGDMAEVEALALEWKARAPWAEGRNFDHALAWLAFRQGRYAEAASLLKPLVRSGHHTLATAPIWHADLGDTHAALGDVAAAQGQWRMALAAAWRPEHTGWGPMGVERDLAKSVAEHGAAVMVPLSDESPDARWINLAAVIRENGMTHYGSVMAYAADQPDGTAYSVSHYEVKCGGDGASRQPVSMRLVRRNLHDASGAVINRVGPLDWIDPRSETARLDTEARVACFTPLEGVPDASVDYGAMMRALREGA